MKWNTSSRDIAGISSCRPPVFPPFLLLHLSNMRFSCGARVFEPGVFLRFSGQTFFWGCTSPIPDWYRYEHNDWQWSSFSFRWVNHTPQQHHICIYIYISASLWSSRFSYVDVDVRMRGWGFLQNMHSDIGLAFAVIRGVGTQQQKSLGGKGPNQFGGWKIEGTPKARYFKVNLWKHLKRRSMGTYSETQMKLTGMIFDVRTDTQR